MRFEKFVQMASEMTHCQEFQHWAEQYGKSHIDPNQIPYLIEHVNKHPDTGFCRKTLTVVLKIAEHYASVNDITTQWRYREINDLKRSVSEALTEDFEPYLGFPSDYDSVIEMMTKATLVVENDGEFRRWADKYLNNHVVDAETTIELAKSIRDKCILSYGVLMACASYFNEDKDTARMYITDWCKIVQSKLTTN